MSRPIEFVDTSAITPDVTASTEVAIQVLGSEFSRRIKERVAAIKNLTYDETNFDIRPLVSTVSRSKKRRSA